MNTIAQQAPIRSVASHLAAVGGLMLASAFFAQECVAQAVPDWIHKLGDQIKHVAPPATPPPTQSADAPVVTATLRSPANIQEMFAKREVNGEELMVELVALRLTAINPNGASSITTLMGQSSSAFSAKGSSVFDGPLNEVANVLLSKDVSYDNGPVGYFFKELTGDPDALRKETIELPKDTANMTVNQQQSILVMAALVVSARVANKTLQAAQKDFTRLESEYAALLVQRQLIAGLLADTLDHRRKALEARDELQARQMDKDLQQWLTPTDLAFIDSFPSDQSLHNFSNDLGMQNLAIKFLQHTDPERFKDLQATTGGLVSRTHAYLRTTAGVAAFGGFSVVFAKEIAKTAQERNVAQIFRALPFAGKFLIEARPLIVLSADTLYTGVILEPKRASTLYRMAHGGMEVDAKGAKDVFDSVTKTGEAHLFADALFRNQAPGFLYRVYFCDRAEAGRIMDITVPAETRQQFAEGYLNLSTGDGFRFSNALTDESSTSPARLAEPLLSRDQRSVTDSAKIGEVQQATVAHFTKIADDQFTRIILANSDGPYAQMQLGSTLVHLIPSMSSVYAYENYVDKCNEAANVESALPANPATPTRTAKPPIAH